MIVKINIETAWHLMSQTNRETLGVLANLSRVEMADMAFGWHYLPQATQQK